MVKHNIPVPIIDDAPHILVVDDDRRIRQLLQKFLAENGFRVSTAGSAGTAREKMQGLSFDMIVLDIMMPGEDGLSFARGLRKETELPILMLSARAEVESRIEGLEVGVDDYLPKPFEPRELLLRIQSVLRRKGPEIRLPSEIVLGRVTFHVERGELTRDGETVRLTTRERELMQLFARQPGKAISRNDLYKDEGGGARAIDVQINRLRRKIEADPATPVYLQTVRGAGYILYTD
jgi:two-component system phosphate regulon response regulator OmpR